MKNMFPDCFLIYTHNLKILGLKFFLNRKKLFIRGGVERHTKEEKKTRQGKIDSPQGPTYGNCDSITAVLPPQTLALYQSGFHLSEESRLFYYEHILHYLLSLKKKNILRP